MPLSENTQNVETSKALASTMRAAAGDAPKSFRPAHARGHVLTGTFTPSSKASELTKAPHFSASSTPITVRFSSSTGIPTIPDTDPGANPRGFAVRFHLPESNCRRQHTDIITHSTPYFAVKTGAEFLEFLKAAGGAAQDGGAAVKAFLSTRPYAQEFLGADKPSPVSFATEQFWGINAFKFISKDGSEKYVRYRVVPVGGRKSLSAEETKAKSESYLWDGLKDAVPFEYKLEVQIAGPDDQTNDATVYWPEDREIVELGTIKVEKSLGEQESLGEQKKIIFDPIPRVDGIEASDDPLLETRANVYLVTGRERRAA